jgi:hypothetical protein
MSPGPRRVSLLSPGNQVKPGRASLVMARRFAEPGSGSDASLNAGAELDDLVEALCAAGGGYSAHTTRPSPSG